MCASLTLILCACPPVLADVAPPDGTWVSWKHAHNDYEHARPLFDALDARFESVEADVWLNGNDIGVSHTGAPFKGSLKSLYLDPLEARVAEHGGSENGVYGDARTFFLWLDLKQSDPKLLDLIASQLELPFVTRFDDSGVASLGAVTVLLTGEAQGKEALTNRPAPRPFARDSNDYSPSDPRADGKWGTYAVSYASFFTWDGRGTLPASQKRQLDNLVNGAHTLGRRLRIYANPETPEYWKAAKAAKVDFIGGDDLAALAAAVAP